MKKLKLNPEFFRRHLAVCLLMVIIPVRMIWL